MSHNCDACWPSRGCWEFVASGVDAGMLGVRPIRGLQCVCAACVGVRTDQAVWPLALKKLVLVPALTRPGCLAARACRMLAKLQL